MEGQQQHEVHICGECGRSPEVIAVRLCGALTCQSADTARASTCSRSLLRELFSKTGTAWWLADGGVWHVPTSRQRSFGNGLTGANGNVKKIINNESKRLFGETPSV